MKYKFRDQPTSNLLLHWSLTLDCLNHCVYCFRYKENKKLLSLKKAIKLIERLADNDVTHLFFTGGEIRERDNLPILLSVATNCGMYTSLDIDGRYFTEKMLNKIEPNLDCLGLSLDSAEAEKNDSLRGKGHWNAVDRILNYTKDKAFAVRVHSVVTRKNLSLKKLAEYLTDKRLACWTLHELSPMFAVNETLNQWYKSHWVGIDKIIQLKNEITDAIPNLIIKIVSEKDREKKYLLISPSGELYTHFANREYKSYGSLLKFSLLDLIKKAEITPNSLSTVKRIDDLLSKGEKRAKVLVKDTDNEAINDPQNIINLGVENYMVFRDRVLRGMTFQNGVLKHAKFIRCDLSHTSFQNVDLYRSSFRSCYLYDTRFKSCNLTRADFQSSNLYGIRFSDCDYTQTLFDNDIFVREPKNSIPSPDIEHNVDNMKAEVYGTLAKLKKEALNFVEASNYRYKQKIFLRKSKPCWKRFVEYMLADLTSHYSENPVRVLLVSGLIILFFASVFFSCRIVLLLNLMNILKPFILVQ